MVNWQVHAELVTTRFNMFHKGVKHIKLATSGTTDFLMEDMLMHNSATQIQCF